MKKNYLLPIFLLLSVFTFHKLQAYNLMNSVNDLEYLKHKNDPDTLASAISFKPTDRWQLVGSSQNYDTSYGIYSKIICNSTGNKIDTLKLKIVNYKGTVRIGLHSASITSENNGKDVKLLVAVQALNSRKAITLEKRISIPFDTKNGYLRTERILLPMYITKTPPSTNEEKKYFFKKKLPKEKLTINGYDDIFNCQREIFATARSKFEINYTQEELKNTSPRIKELLYILRDEKRMIFDTEYYFIDGTSHVIKKYDYDDDPKNKAVDIGDRLPGFRCKMGTFKIL